MAVAGGEGVDGGAGVDAVLARVRCSMRGKHRQKTHWHAMADVMCKFFPKCTNDFCTFFHPT